VSLTERARLLWASLAGPPAQFTPEVSVAVVPQSRRAAAAGYRDWPPGTAHLSVLTGPWARGRGLAKAAASAAVASALADGRLAQWRARRDASRRVALALGFQELGAQVSFRLRAAGGE
jgi:RimJ/RimL family protein N-acetyltransferase